ncbi:MAG: imelysin family protein [Pseudomonadota bacterium]|nr:imelysin family protein [Pseudomonadota bacterium]
MRIRPTLIALSLAFALPQAQAETVTAERVVQHYAGLVQASYDDTLAAARDMQRAIDTFSAAPSQQTLDTAREAWRQAREFYGQTEVFRFYGGPIDDEGGIEGRLNSWPLDESYVDYVEGRPGSGFINDRRFKISKANIARMNERGGEENISAGWHAIEFLLWGQDMREDGAGNRSFEDFIDGKGTNAQRRRQYLQVVTELLVDDLASLAREWAASGNNYRARFSQQGQEAVRKIIVGMGSLSRGELAGERLEVPMASQDQEDEQSCFSDNTHRDTVNNALGIRNVWRGEYRRRDGSRLQGPGIGDLVAAANPQLAEKTGAQIEASLKAAEAIQAPFDREIIGDETAPGRQRVQATIDSLTAQSKLLIESANAIGIQQLTLVEP